MFHSADDAFAGHDARGMAEGVVRVVAVEGDKVWLEPEPPASGCGSCATSALCSAKSGSKLEMRRFSLVNHEGLQLGDRVVVGIAESMLLKASLLAYALPLLGLVVGMVWVQSATGSDGYAFLGGVAGLVLGLALARMRAGRLWSRGELSPQVLRRAPALDDVCDESFGTERG